MARFFFDTVDGETVADTEGVELPSLAAAQIEAIRMLGELLREHAEEFWVTRTFAITVSDRDSMRLVITTSAVHTPHRGHVAHQTDQ